MQTEKIKIRGEVQHILEECQSIAENSLYTGQSHYEMAHELHAAGKRKTFFLVAFPAGIAALAALSVLLSIPPGLPKEIPSIIGALSALYSAIAALFPSNEAQASHHTAIGNQLTVLRHDADRLHNAYWQEYSRGELLHQVELLRVRYETIIASAAMPSASAFKTARRRIKSKLFVPDFKMDPSQDQPLLLSWLTKLLGRREGGLPGDSQAEPSNPASS